VIEGSAGGRVLEVRRRVGPVAWCALECLLERSADGGRSTVSTVRGIAAELGVAKNTAHRALAALNRAGLIEPLQTRGSDGRFGAGRYRLHVAGLFAEPAPTPTVKTSQQRKTAVAPEQLALIP
jgi:DNA-binding transcriptional MocR family regulator